jgi:tRNA threonylcarbamoyl adenosine modification protein YeaZ
MRILFFDTSFDFILVEIYEISFSQINNLYSFKEYCPRESSFRLIKEIETALAVTGLEKVDKIICSLGPGSFTGIRITVSTARNLSQLWNIPCIGVDSLEVYIHYFYDKYNRDIVLILDSKQKQAYVAEFDGKYFLNSKDISIETLKNQYMNTDKLIISDLSIFREYTLFNGELPDGKSYFFRNFRKFQTEELDTKYSNIFPNYMRESYAKK